MKNVYNIFKATLWGFLDVVFFVSFCWGGAISLDAQGYSYLCAQGSFWMGSGNYMWG